MVIWILQGLFNLLMLNVAMLWILNRKRTRFLLDQVEQLRSEVESLKTQVKNVSAPQKSTSATAPVSSAKAEMTNIPIQRSTANISPRAEMLLAPMPSTAPTQVIARTPGSPSASVTVPMPSSASTQNVSPTLAPGVGASTFEPRIQEPARVGLSVPPVAAEHRASVDASSRVGNLVEKRAELSSARPVGKAETADAYERASQMLARGVAVKDVSRQTGLSMAELQLMSKVSSRTQ